MVQVIIFLGVSGLKLNRGFDRVKFSPKMYFVKTNEPDLNPILGPSLNSARVGLVLRVKNLGQVGSGWVKLGQVGSSWFKLVHVSFGQ